MNFSLLRLVSISPTSQAARGEIFPLSMSMSSLIHQWLTACKYTKTGCFLHQRTTKLKCEFKDGVVIVLKGALNDMLCYCFINVT